MLFEEALTQSLDGRSLPRLIEFLGGIAASLSLGENLVRPDPGLLWRDGAVGADGDPA
ncbi:unnamed protein product [Pararhodospirillum photometricum DSM 122]|uniref:Uncharacterized protein n=1 Tax=Pararhodospirillum photometricum DSM 122 TaxID=1150469 RepID=H6SKU6_PARPM|nr:unnamed protein product [Pararhodospirillum photometricum DSM 122]